MDIPVMTLGQRQALFWCLDDEAVLSPVRQWCAFGQIQAVNIDSPVGFKGDKTHILGEGKKALLKERLDEYYIYTVIYTYINIYIYIYIHSISKV